LAVQGGLFVIMHTAGLWKLPSETTGASGTKTKHKTAQDDAVSLVQHVGTSLLDQSCDRMLEFVPKDAITSDGKVLFAVWGSQVVSRSSSSSTHAVVPGAVPVSIIRNASWAAAHHRCFAYHIHGSHMGRGVCSAWQWPL
jgi:hypothetical protein